MNALVRILSASGPNWQGMELAEGSDDRVVYLSNSSSSTNKIAPQSSPLSEEGKKHLHKPIPDMCFLILALGLYLSFDSLVALIFTPVTNLLPFK